MQIRDAYITSFRMVPIAFETASGISCVPKIKVTNILMSLDFCALAFIKDSPDIVQNRPIQR